MKAMKTFNTALGAIFAVMALTACGSVIRARDLVIADIDFAEVRTGVYVGSMKARIDTAKVEVRVDAGRVESIRILEHVHGPGYGAEAIAERVVAAQSLMVDAVSGATASSKTILKAIEFALVQGL
jgi:uncharacterized protein with FMN-binding domain